MSIWSGSLAGNRLTQSFFNELNERQVEDESEANTDEPQCPPGWVDELWDEDKGKIVIGKKQNGVNTMEVARFMGIEINPPHKYQFIDYDLRLIQHLQGDFCYKEPEVPHGWKVNLGEDDKGKTFKALLLGNPPQYSFPVGKYEGIFFDEDAAPPYNTFDFYIFINTKGEEVEQDKGFYCYREVEEGENATSGGSRKRRKTRVRRGSKPKGKSKKNRKAKTMRLSKRLRLKRSH